MPIYAYKCASCGHSKDVLQKFSDDPLVTCPSCGQPAFSKQITAAGFQLKGSGWYATDFRGASQTPATATGADGAKKADVPAKEGEHKTSSSPVPSDRVASPQTASTGE